MPKARFTFKCNRLRKRKPHNIPLLRPSIPIGWRLRLLRDIFTQQTQASANRNARSKQWHGCLPTQALAFEWKPGLMQSSMDRSVMLSVSEMKTVDKDDARIEA